MFQKNNMAAGEGQPVEKNSPLIMTGEYEEIKRNTVRQWNPVIPELLTVELAEIGGRRHIGLIPVYGPATFLLIPDGGELAHQMEASAALELFQGLYEQGRAT